MSTTIRMPQLGESVVEGTVGKWLVNVGDSVKQDQPVVEILTDKADSEVPAPQSGVVTKILVQEGDVVQVGGALLELDTSASASTAVAKASPAVPPSSSVHRGSSAGGLVTPPVPSAAASGAQAASATPANTGNGNGRGSAAPSSPSVRKLAREQGIDLKQLEGTGDGGRVTRDDVLRAAEPSSGAQPPSAYSSIPPLPPKPAPQAQPAAIEPEPRAAQPTPAGARPAVPAGGAFKLPPYIARPGDEVVPLTRRRRIIADHMVFSKVSAPHVVTFAECDLHKTDKLRRANKDRLKAEGVNLTILSFVAAACTRALREHKIMNARMLDDAYVMLSEINLGIAVNTPEGLVVPVVRHADELTVRGLARAIDALALKARDNALTPDDLAAKTFTISNPGRNGNMVGGAIISQPNVGILRTGEIKKRVVVVEHDGEDLMAIHPVMYMALSYDHRIVDGVDANEFLHRVVEILEQADFSL
jgi:2-oxoglutarate dehydrogenase E2 component (dihydrolipoamide succinyltransferase)